MKKKNSQKFIFMKQNFKKTVIKNKSYIALRGKYYKIYAQTYMTKQNFLIEKKFITKIYLYVFL